MKTASVKKLALAGILCAVAAVVLGPKEDE